MAKKLPPRQPGEILRQEFLVPLELTPYAVAAALNVPRAGRRGFQVQPIQMPHDGEVGGRHWSRQIINAAAADLQTSARGTHRNIAAYWLHNEEQSIIVR
jgi:hypothetical protein